jgi:excisionase family DNA binding protein
MSASVQPPERNPNPSFDIHGAAQYSGLSVRFLRRLTHEKRIEVIRIGGRVRFRKSALDAVIAAHVLPAERTGPPADRVAAMGTKVGKKKVGKMNTDAAPSDRIIYAERADPITPPVKTTNTASGPDAE